MLMWKFKSCPRCGGDIFIDRESHGWSEHCLQCGYQRDIPNTVEVHQRSDDRKKEELSELHRPLHR